MGCGQLLPPLPLPLATTPLERSLLTVGLVPFLAHVKKRVLRLRTLTISLHDPSRIHVQNSILYTSYVNNNESLPRTVDFTSLTSFKTTINDVDYSDFLKVFFSF